MVLLGNRLRRMSSVIACSDTPRISAASLTVTYSLRSGAMPVFIENILYQYKIYFNISTARFAKWRFSPVASTKRAVALYARVSTRGLGQDPEGQLIGLREYAQRRGWTIVGEYVDNGFSGARSATRPALQQLWKDARQRKFDVVAVWKLDRFGRSLRDLVNSLDEFRALGIEFVSLTEAIDFGSSLGAVMFALIGAMAEFERNLIRERVSMGMARARKQGRDLGRPKVAVNPHYVAALRHDGLSWNEIATKLGVGRGTVCRAYESLSQKAAVQKAASAS
jgi:DNA invertase Pin-like site-specific DNA recombinase